jgi:hypothetical protein
MTQIDLTGKSAPILGADGNVTWKLLSDIPGFSMMTAHGTSPGSDRTKVQSASYCLAEKSIVIGHGGETFGLPQADFAVLAQQFLEGLGCQVIAAPAA